MRKARSGWQEDLQVRDNTVSRSFYDRFYEDPLYGRGAPGSIATTASSVMVYQGTRTTTILYNNVPPGSAEVLLALYLLVDLRLMSSRQVLAISLSHIRRYYLP